MTIPMSMARHLLKTVTLEPFTGSAGGGGSTYGAATTYSVRIEHQLVPMGKDKAGQEVVSRTQVFFDSEVSIAVNDRITLPTGYSPSQPPIRDIRRQAAGQSGGLSHTEVLL